MHLNAIDALARYGICSPYTDLTINSSDFQIIKLIESYIPSVNHLIDEIVADTMESPNQKKVAGVVIFRKDGANIKYLMLKPIIDGKEYSPPKGKLETAK